METASVGTMLNILYVARNFVAQAGKIKAFLINLFSFVWAYFVRLFIDNLYIAVLLLSCANRTFTNFLMQETKIS